MTQDGHASAAVEVPVAVVGHVDERRRIRRAVIGHDQLVIGRELVGEVHLDRAGETLVAVGRVEDELDKAAVLPLLRARDGPEALAPEVAAAVIAVLALVGSELVGFARQLERSAADSVDHAADRGAEPRVVGRVARGVVVAEHYVDDLAGGRRHPHGHDARAKVRDRDLHARGVAKLIEKGRSTADASKRNRLYLHCCPSRPLALDSAKKGWKRGRGIEPRARVWDKIPRPFCPNLWSGSTVWDKIPRPFCPS